jgi:hypothetical protein
MISNTAPPPPDPEPPLPPLSSEGFRTPHSALRTPSSRTGKIARLPRAIREQLNQRLDDGEEAKHLVAWLNSLPEVQAVLSSLFHAQPINEPNLTQWKQGGFLDWQNLQQTRLAIAQLAEDADTLRSDTPAPALADKLSTVLAAGFVLAARGLLDPSTDPQARWQRLREILPALARLRRADYQSQLLDLARRRADRLDADAQAAHADSLERHRLTTLAQEQLISDLFASTDPSLKALAAGLSENLLAAQAQAAATTPASGPAN